MPELPPAPPPCPRCRSAHVVRNGSGRAGEPSFRCRGCGRRFVESPRGGPISDQTKALVERLLGERMALRAICRAVGVSRTWLQSFVNDLYRERTPRDPGPLKKKPATW